MRHPERWRDTTDPFALPYRHFRLTEVVGYPHAGNDVFQARGVYRGNEVEAFIKVARQTGADIANEIRTIQALNWSLAPEIIDHDEKMERFVVTLAKRGERLSTILGDNTRASLGYLFEYGRTLGKLHGVRGDFAPVKDRKFFHIPDEDYFAEAGLLFVRRYLLENKPEAVEPCFCHGDFHYANLLWADGRLSAILDFELSGMGDREFDVAWALIRRPGQRFLNTEEEICRFFDGYASAASCDPARVAYYMALIYSWFWAIGGNDPEYREWVRNALHTICAHQSGVFWFSEYEL